MQETLWQLCDGFAKYNLWNRDFSYVGSKGVIESNSTLEPELESNLLQKIESPETILELMSIGLNPEKIKTLNERATRLPRDWNASEKKPLPSKT